MKFKKRPYISRLVLLLVLFILPVLFNKTNIFATSITLNVANTVSLNIINGSNANGSYASSSDSDTIISVATDNYTGYTLGIAASNSDVTALTNTDNNSTIPSITSAVDDSTFSSSINYNNKWGYKPSKINSTVNTNFLPAPSASTSNPDTLDQTNSPNPSEANNYNISIAAKVNNTTAPGTYTNTYIITAIANGTPYTLTYNANAGGETVSNMPTNITDGISYADTINLGTTTPTRTGYDFSGWCTSNSSQTNCSSTLYNSTNDNLANFPIDRTSSSNNLNVYAIWKSKPYSITLTNTNATTSGSTSARALYGTTTVYGGTSGTSKITSPQREYNFSGFTKTNSAYNATVSSTATKTYTYTFDGWYTASSGGTRVITATGTLVSNVSGYTNSSGQWNRTSSTTLYAHWTAGTNQTLPTIAQTDSTYGNGNCYWSTSNSTTGTQAYASGGTISSPTANATLYGVCKFPVKITFAGSGVSKVEVRSGSTTGTLIGTVSSSGGSVSGLQYGTNYYLVPTYSDYYGLNNWAKNSSKGTLSSTSAANPYITIGTTSSTGAVGITITGKSTKVYMWNATSANCGQTLWDNRDGTERSYTTASINGLCWMTTNLSLGKSTTTALTSSTSNVSSSGYTLPASSTTGFSGTSTAYIYNSGSTTCSSSSSCYGYYNFVAATAGVNPSSGNSSYDICPAGWRLPTRAELQSLISTYNTLALLTGSPFKAVRSGYYIGSSNPNRGSYGGYWSSTGASSSNAYYLEYDSGKLQVASSGYGKQPGYGIRCVAKQ